MEISKPEFSFIYTFLQFNQKVQNAVYLNFQFFSFLIGFHFIMSIFIHLFFKFLQLDYLILEYLAIQLFYAFPIFLFLDPFILVHFNFLLFIRLSISFIFYQLSSQIIWLILEENHQKSFYLFFILISTQ